MSIPSYIQLYQEGELSERLKEAFDLLNDCRLCPRQCGVDRLNNKKGQCQTGRNAKVASYSPHFGEESPLVGRFGSGTIFFSYCSLRCSFCQNYEISHGGEGVEVEEKDLAEMMIRLQNRGCHNINLVTPTHVVPQILKAILLAAEKGLNIPIVYNSSGYDSAEVLTLLDGVIDIYMPDFKFWDERWSERYCLAPDYRKSAMRALKEMHMQVGDLTINTQGIAERGLLVRHLVMPHGISGTRHIMEFIAREISASTYINIMDQYRPCGTAHGDKYINRKITRDEYSDALDWAAKAGLKRLDQKRGFQLIFDV